MCTLLNKKNPAYMLRVQRNREDLSHAVLTTITFSQTAHHIKLSVFPNIPNVTDNIWYENQIAFTKPTDDANWLLEEQELVTQNFFTVLRFTINKGKADKSRILLEHLSSLNLIHKDQPLAIIHRKVNNIFKHFIKIYAAMYVRQDWKWHVYA